MRVQVTAPNKANHSETSVLIDGEPLREVSEVTIDMGVGKATRVVLTHTIVDSATLDVDVERVIAVAVPATLGDLPAEMMRTLDQKYQLAGRGIAHRFVFDVLHAWAHHIRHGFEPATPTIAPKEETTEQPA